MTKLAEAIANTVEAAKSGNGADLGSSIVDIVSSGASLVGKLFGLKFFKIKIQIKGVINYGRII